MDRDAILADFQACTGIEDVELAICQLDDANWSLVDAVNSVMSSSSAPGTSEYLQPPPPPVEAPLSVASPYAQASIADDFITSGPSSQRTRMLEFSIQHNERIIHLKVPDNEDVKTLKQLLSAETGFPTCQLDLSGFRSSGNPIAFVSDRRRLSELSLPKENVLQLSTPLPSQAPTANGEPEPDAGSGKDFKLHISNVDDGGKVLTLNFRPSQTVFQVKLDMSALTSTPISRQIWTGWPPGATNERTLWQIGIPREHHLSFASRAVAAGAASASTSDKRSNQSSGRPSDEEEDEFVDASDMMDDDDFLRPSSVGADSRKSSRLQPLLPEDFDSDDAMAAIKFSEEFVGRYGAPHPEFFPGSLDDAIKQSCLQPAKERKMLAVYLHHDGSVLSNVFCAQVLCADSAVAFLSENFVNFGWDVTHASNMTRAVTMITRHFGSVAASTVKNLEVERFPLIALVYRLRGTTEIFQMIHGNVTLDELMSQLLSAQETYNVQLSLEIREEGERAARDAVKREQDLAFEMSLVADREKEAQKRREKEERLRKEAVEAALIKSQEEEAKRKGEAKLQLQENIRSMLPKEPKDEQSEGVPVSQLRFRLPDGRCSNGFLLRRFLASDTLQILIDFLASEGYPSDEFKIISSWPRRDVTVLDPGHTLKELKFYPQETLTLEEK